MLVVLMYAGDDITVTQGADLSADSQNANSDGGTVIVFADDAAVLGAGAAYQLTAARLVTADLLSFRQFALLSWQADNYRPLHKTVSMALS